MWHVDGVLLGTAIGPLSKDVRVLLVSIPAMPTRSCILHYSGNCEQLRYSIMSGVDYEEFVT